MLILLDQDNVLADFDRAFHDAWTRSSHEHPAVPFAGRTSFHVRDDYPPHLTELVASIYNGPGFIRNLPPIPLAIEAVHAMTDLGHDVRICTSPLDHYRHCLHEKYEWVECHLGADYVQKVVVTKDKTLVHGDVLVDDKPEIIGSRQPGWQRVVFDRPWNRHVQGTRITWENWRGVLCI